HLHVGPAGKAAAGGDVEPAGTGRELHVPDHHGHRHHDGDARPAGHHRSAPAMVLDIPPANVVIVAPRELVPTRIVPPPADRTEPARPSRGWPSGPGKVALGGAAEDQE